MVDDTRLRAIEQRAKALGMKTTIFDDVWMAFLAEGDIEIKINEQSRVIITGDNIQAAERLLACYEPGAVVEVKIVEPDYKGYIIKYSDGFSHHVPVNNAADCPGAGRYKLVKVE